MTTNVNVVLIEGNLTRDPEMRYTQTGTAVLNFTVAVNRRVQAPAGSREEEREDTAFVDVTVWAKLAESCAEYLKRGRPVLVEGRLAQERWTDKEGQNRTKLAVVGEKVRFLGPPPKREEPAPAGAPSQG